jgi:hypothetical protein
VSEVRTDAFALPLPEGWADRTVVTLAGPADHSGYAPNIVVTREVLCDHMGLGAFSQGWQTLLSDQVPVTPHGEVEQTEIAGRRANIRTVSWAAAGVHLTQIAFLFVEGELGYAIVGTCTHDRFGEFEPVFRQVAAGFKLAEEAIR